MASKSDPAHKSLKNSELLNSGMLFVRLWQTVALVLHIWTSKLLIRGIHSTWIYVLVCFHSCLKLAPGQSKMSFPVFGGTPSLSQCCSSLHLVSHSSLLRPIHAGVSITVAVVGIQRPSAIFWIADSLTHEAHSEDMFYCSSSYLLFQSQTSWALSLLSPGLPSPSCTLTY